MLDDASAHRFAGSQEFTAGTLFETPVSAPSGYVTDASRSRVAFSVISRGLD